MNASILSYRLPRAAIQDLQYVFKEQYQTRVALHNCSNFDAVEDALFQKEWDLLIVWDDTQVSMEFIRELKQDELFVAFPVIFVSDTLSFDRAVGYCDLVLHTPQVLLLAAHSYVLFRNYTLYRGVIQNLLAAKEHTIERYLMFDITKRYMSHTTFSCITRAAKTQKLSIPEEVLNLSVVFADVSYFSNMSERLPPHKVIKMLNDLFHLVIPIVHAHNGDIEKFIGDAFLAVFFDARAAIAAMQEVQRRMTEIKLFSENAIQLHVGIHYGPVVRGSVGGDERYDHTLIGNTVNIASRLERACPPGEVLVSEGVLAHAGLPIPRKYMRRMKMRGIHDEINCYLVHRYLETHADLLKSDVFSLDACRKSQDPGSREKPGKIFLKAE